MSRTDPTQVSSKRPAWELFMGGACWIATLEFLVGQAIAQAAWTTPYSLVDDAVSDLGNTTCGEWPPAGTAAKLFKGIGTHYYVCSPLHTVMNASFIVTGVLVALGVYFTRGAWPQRRLTGWGLTFLALAGLGKIVVGLDPENVRPLLHTLGALNIPCANIGIVLLGLGVWRTRRAVGVFSVVLGGVGFLAFLILLAISASGHGFGVAERIADYTIIVWLVTVGIGLVVGARSRAQVSSA